jgi:two-component system phosphate regulon sensor histidine kinase PhoR
MRKGFIERLTIRQVSWLTTLVVTLFAIVTAIVFSLDISLISKVFMGIALFLVNFLTIKFLGEKFIFQKIKVIYKLITDAKKEKTTSDYPSNNLEAINQQVLEWAQNTQSELASLQTLEEYRKNYVGNISHELKTPIFTIQGYLHTLLDGGIHDPNVNMKFLTKAAENTDRLQNIVEDMEAISKFESGQVELELTDFDLKDLCNDVIHDIQSIADQKMVSIRFKEKSMSTAMVSADKNAIRQVLINLLVNSVKYGRDGGVTKIGLYDLDSEILCDISDNGIGIEEKHIKHLFDRFYRVDPSRSRKQGGSGLGLSIVKHIIEAHHQTIHVRSTVDVGSTFGFTLKKA